MEIRTSLWMHCFTNFRSSEERVVLPWACEWRLAVGSQLSQQRMIDLHAWLADGLLMIHSSQDQPSDATMHVASFCDCRSFSRDRSVDDTALCMAFHHSGSFVLPVVLVYLVASRLSVLFCLCWSFE